MLKKTKSVLVIFSLLFLLTGNMFVVWCADPTETEHENALISMDFFDVDINVFIKFVSEITGKKFIVDPSIKGTVNVISPTKLTKEEAYEVFQSVLEVHGYTTVAAGKIIKIVPQQKAKDKGVQTITDQRGYRGQEMDTMVTRIIPLRYADAVELQSLLTPLISSSSVMVAHGATNTLIVTDINSNIDRLIQIIREIDVPGFAKKITVIKLVHANAAELAKQLAELMEDTTTPVVRTSRKQRSAGQSETSQLKIIPEERTNTLVVLAAYEDTQKIKQLVRQLDQPTPTGRDFIHVYYLKNGVAEDVAKVLGEIKKESGTDSKTAQVTKPAISKDVMIIPDKATNSLVIRATPEEYQSISKVIEKLDIPRSMVFVEGLIVEVTSDEAMKLGVEWRIGDDFDDGDSVAFGQVGAGTQGTLSGIDAAVNTEDALFSLPSGLALGVIGRQITFGDITFPSIAALVNAVANDTDFNILSTPQILTTDNTEAEVKVAQNLPFLTRLDQGTDITSRSIQSFEYRDVGVILKVTPQINKDRFVRLIIEEEVKNVVQAQTASSRGEVLLAPTTNVRSAKTTVVVKDGETVVIGGLIQDTQQGSEVRVPCLGEMPLFGALFRTKSDSQGKINLMVFLTPHIVENTEEARALYLKKREEIEKIRREQSTLKKPLIEELGKKEGAGKK